MEGELWMVSKTATPITGIVLLMNTLAAHGFAYEACDIPADMTIAEFRARRASARAGSSSVLRRLRRPLRVMRTRS
jgi:hypothetical protein